MNKIGPGIAKIQPNTFAAGISAYPSTVKNVWWHDATLYVYFSYFYNIHTYIHTITFIRRHSLRPLTISSSLVCSVGKTPCGAEPRIEVGTEFIV